MVFSIFLSLGPLKNVNGNVLLWGAEAGHTFLPTPAINIPHCCLWSHGRNVKVFLTFFTGTEAAGISSIQCSVGPQIIFVRNCPLVLMSCSRSQLHPARSHPAEGATPGLIVPLGVPPHLPGVPGSPQWHLQNLSSPFFPWEFSTFLSPAGEEEMKGRDYFHDRKIYPKRGSLHGIFGRKLHFYLNISFRNSLVHRQTRKSRNDLGKE